MRGLAYGPMIGGMLDTGVGAGLLNGETTKVGMTVIPKERSGMASGVSGTVRFTGLVIAALGVVLYGRVPAVVADALPQASTADRQALVEAITAGHLAAGAFPGRDPASMKDLAIASFASGYQWLFLSGAVFMAESTLLTWCLVSATETPPVSAPAQCAVRQVAK